MINAKALSSQQSAVIEGFFGSELEEDAILQKNKLSRNLYDKLLTDETFIGWLDKRFVWEYRRGEFKLARYTRVAVSNLVRPTGFNKPETPRKGCFDMITMCSNHSVEPSAISVNNTTLQHESRILSPDTTGKLLAFLAEEKNN